MWQRITLELPNIREFRLSYTCRVRRKVIEIRRVSRQKIRAALQQRIDSREPIILGGAGIGLVAKAIDLAGIDIIMAYNTGPFRMDGHGSLAGYLAYGDANQMTMNLAASILPVVERTPVVAGIGAADPYRDSIAMIDVMLDLGYSGITNVPTAGLYDGNFRRQIDGSNLGYPREIELIASCHAKDVFSVAYAFSEEESAAMARAGADIIGAHVGLTSGGLIGSHSAMTVVEACSATQRMVVAARSERPDAIVVAHGGPFEDARTVQQVFAETDVDGYLGASSIERLPIERALREVVDGFRALRLRRRWDNGVQ